MPGTPIRPKLIDHLRKHPHQTVQRSVLARVANTGVQSVTKSMWHLINGGYHGYVGQIEVVTPARSWRFIPKQGD